MNKKLLILLIILLMHYSFFYGAQRELSEVIRPDTFVINKDFIYIGEKHQVYVFSSGEMSLIKKFGKSGEGPGEFKLGHGINNLTIDVIDGQLVIGSIGKLSVFTLKGNLIFEYKVPPFQRFIRVGDGFLASTSLDGGEGHQVQGIALFDKERNKKKVLLKTDNPVGMGVKIYLPKPNYKYTVYQDKIYLSSDLDKISIQVFGFSGEKSSTIDYPMDQLTIPGRYKEKLRNYYKTDPNWKNFWGYLKQFLTFRRNFPAVRDFFIDNDLIYIQTFLIEKGLVKWMVFDLSGNFKGKTLLPNINFYTDQAIMHDILDGVYYYLQENIEEETWHINQNKINIE